MWEFVTLTDSARTQLQHFTLTVSVYAQRHRWSVAPDDRWIFLLLLMIRYTFLNFGLTLNCGGAMSSFSLKKTACSFIKFLISLSSNRSKFHFNCFFTVLNFVGLVCLNYSFCQRQLKNHLSSTSIGHSRPASELVSEVVPQVFWGLVFALFCGKLSDSYWQAQQESCLSSWHLGQICNMSCTNCLRNRR